ncbi:MAG: hypothetical protein GX896_09690 [Clostridiales bacterium]|nr:hypothetical protein [Clostridiales bacterium]
MAGFAQIVFLIPSLKKSQFKYRTVLDFKDPYARRMGKLSIPVIFSTIVSEATVIVNKSLATWLPAGSVTYLTYGELIHFTIMMVFISSMSMMLFPALSRAFARKQLERAHRYLGLAYNAILIVTIPLAIYVGIFAKDIVTILFQRGLFTSIDTLNTAKIVSVYAFCLPAFSIMRITTNAYHANKDTRTPAIFSFMLLILNILFTLILIRFMGVSGIPLASGISCIFVTTCLNILLKKKQGYVFFSRSFVSTAIKVVIASAVCLLFMTIGKLIFQNYISNILYKNLTFIVLSLLTLLLYLLVGHLLKIKEFRSIIRTIKHKFSS